MAEAATDIATEQLRLYWENFEPFANDCLTVRDHNTSQLLPFKFNAPQKILHTVVEQQKSELGYIRCFFLKSRRFGGSTYVQGRFYWRTSLNFNKNTFIIAHEEDSTTTLYKMAQLYHEKNPIAPSTRKTNAKELIFDNKKGDGLKSEYRLATAKNVDAGRSQGIHYLHDSEESSWPSHADDLLSGIFQCVPDPPAESEIFRESTARGYGNTFQIGVFDAYAEGRYPYFTARLMDVCPHMPESEIEFDFAYKNPDDDWIVVFIPWFCIERYVMQFADDEAKEEFEKKIAEKVFDPEGMKWVDSTESKLIEQYGVTLEQLNWRQWKIKNSFKGNIEKFEEEYPATVEEAFKSTGSNVYSRQLCDELQENCMRHILLGEVVDRGGETKIKPNRHGKFSLWERPEKGETYFLTVDSGGGINPTSDTKEKPDPTCIDVWNHRTGAQVAQWHGHIDYGLISNMVYLIGRLYGTAPACVELMNHGYTVVKDLSEMNYPLYENKPGHKGYLTTKKTKPLMVDDLGEMARNGDILIRCSETVSEMRTFVEVNGKYNAASGCHDDRVVSAAMASQMLVLLPKRFKKLSEESSDFEGFSNIHDRYQPEKADTYYEIYVD